MPGVGEVTTSGGGGGGGNIVLDGDEEVFLCTPETGRRCCHDNRGTLFEDPEGDEYPVGLKPDMIARGE